MSKKILELKNVNKYFITSDGKTLKACNNINLDMKVKILHRSIFGDGELLWCKRLDLGINA